MAETKFGFVARWAWLPLIVLGLFLAGQLRTAYIETSDLERRATTVTRLADGLRSQMAPAAKPTTSTQPTKQAPPQTSSKVSRPAGVLSGWSDNNALGDPEYGAVIARRQRRYTMGNYHHAIDALHLSPADEQRLKQLLITEWNTRVDISDIAQRAPADLAAVREKAQAAAKGESERQIRALLGDEAYAEFQSAYQVSVEYTTNWGLFTGFWDAGVALSDDQQWSLAEVLSQVHAQYRQPNAANPEDPRTGLRASGTALLNAAAQFLSPEQLAYLRNDELDQARYRQLIRDVQAEKKTATGGGR